MPVCSEPGCPTITPPRTYRCPIHQRAAEQARGSRQARGYDAGHTRQRAIVARNVAAGRAHCARCGGLIAPTQPWDLGHTDDRTGWTGAEHQHCNRAAGGRAAHR